MSPHQALALGVRLFVIWLAVISLQQWVAYFSNRRAPGILDLVLLTAGIGLSIAGLLALWFFPKSIARSLLPPSTEPPSENLSYQRWFALGTALLGLWFVASSIRPIVHNLMVMALYEPEFTDFDNFKDLKAGIFVSAIDVVIGLYLLFGANGITRFIQWARRAGTQQSGTEA